MADPVADGEYRDPVSGKPVVVRGGKVQLRNKFGALFEQDPSQAGYSILKGDFDAASHDEVSAFDRKKELELKHGGVGGAAAAAGVALGRGAIDATIALPKLATGLGAAALGEKDPLGDVTGGQFLEDLQALSADDPVAAANLARKTQRELAEANPTATTIGETAGQIAASLPAGISGAAKTVAGRTALGALEGAALGGATAGEDAYIKDYDLTRDQMLASMGLGAVMGGAVTLGGEGVARAFRRVGSRGSTPFDSPRDAGAYRTPHAPDYDALAKRALNGIEPAPGMGAKLRDAVESVQSGVTGAEKNTLQKYGLLRRDPESIAGRDLWRNRTKILDETTRDLTDHVDTLVTKRRDLTEEVVDSNLKRSHVRSLLQNGDQAAMKDAARVETARLRAELQGVALDVEAYGNAELVKSTRKLILGLAETAKKGDPADGFIAIDQAKRGLQRQKVGLARSAMNQSNEFKRQQALRLSAKFDELQEGSRQLLMNEGIWGAEAAGAQRAINSEFEMLITSQELFEKNLLTRTGTGYDARPTLRADDKKISAFLDTLGREQGKLADEQIRHHVIATQRLADSIEKAFDLSPEKRAAVRAIRDSAETISKKLNHADKTIKVANQIDAVMAADKGMGGMPGAVLGGIVGGPVGAAIGGAASLLSKPGAQIRMLAAIEAMTQNVDSHIVKSFRSLLDNGIGPLSLPPIRGAKRALTAGGTAGGVQTFAKEGEDRNDAYRRRVKETLASVINPAAASNKLSQSMGELSEHAPKLSGALSLGAVKAQLALAARIPAGAIKVNPLTGVHEVTDVSEEEREKFATEWETFNNPLSILHDLRRGMLTGEQVAIVKEHFPPLFTRMQLLAREELASSKREIDYDVRTQLDLLLDLNGAGEPALSPSFQRLLATVAMSPDAGGPPLAPGAGMSAGSGRPSNPKLADRFHTLGASLETGGGL